MNDLSDIARAVAEAAPTLETCQQADIPMDESRMIHVLRGPAWPAIMLAVSDQPVVRDAAAQDAARESLLRLAADTRWTGGLAGGLDAQDREYVLHTHAVPLDAESLEAALAAMLARLAVPPAQTGANEPAPAPAAPPPGWLRA